MCHMNLILNIRIDQVLKYCKIIEVARKVTAFIGHTIEVLNEVVIKT